MTAGYPKNMKELNRFLQQHGLNVTAHQADGFVYFKDAAGEEAGDVDVEGARSLPFAEWYEEARQAQKRGPLGGFIAGMF